MKNENILLSLAAVFISVLTAYAVRQPPNQYDEQVLKLHCEMVQVWEETNGEFGWPDYNDTAALCEEVTNK